MNVTKEKLDAQFVKEEFMRVNGHQQQHLLIGPVADQRHHMTHWHALHDTCAWADSHRSQSVRTHTPLTQRYAAVGRLANSIPNTKISSTNQLLVLEQIARQEGCFMYDPPEDDDEKADEE